VTILHDVPRQWRCRLCGCECYHRFTVLRENGKRYQTEFFYCGGCTVIFTNDRQFDGKAVVESCRASLTRCQGPSP